MLAPHRKGKASKPPRASSEAPVGEDLTATSYTRSLNKTTTRLEVLLKVIVVTPVILQTVSS
ncbi:hypothetical protein M413DRAFT_440241 [Hebeloma cylindrosporum]|uniref:Uncharacterized protein n=1 Tax=Hebeloma cylindrosporum TaxID=76867 RepID=A0A0C3CD02_HEBCY|nr:hypothetical protein M413DRAFT_440241 [Hebeloma cylindrosporum h7]